MKQSEEHQNNRTGPEHSYHSSTKLNGSAKVGFGPECLFPGMHCPPPVFFVPPSIDPLFGSAGSANPLSTSARLDIFLKGGSVTVPTKGVAGWFADNFGIFTTRLEKYSVRDFIEKYSRFLHDAFLRNVLFVDVDYTLLYADKKNEHPEDLSRAINRAYEHLAQDSTPTNTVVVSVVGRTNRGLGDDLELTVEGQFFHRHDSNKPGIEIMIVGIPSSLVKKHTESKPGYEARLKQLSHELEDPANREKFRSRHEEIMRLLVADYKHHLSGLFEIENVNEKIYVQPKGADAPKSARVPDEFSLPSPGHSPVSN